MPEADPTITRRFGARVRALRQRQGVSQEAFALRAGLDRTYMSGVERGVRNVSLRTIAILARALDVSLSELFEGL